MSIRVMRCAASVALAVAFALSCCPLSLAAEDQPAELPSSFDLRDTGVVGPARNQMPWGACWAFAAMAASETSILSEQGSTYASSGLVLSPRHLAWFSGTALPDADTMAATTALASYASQAGEGTTVRPLTLNDYGSPLETGGFSFEAAVMMAAGVGPVIEEQAPYRNDENMAEVKSSEPVATLERGQTLDEFLAEHPGDYNGFNEMGEDGYPSMIVRARREATQELIDAGALAYYAGRPAFDDEGHLILDFSASTPRYTWGLPDAERFSRSYELEEYRILPTPTGGVAGEPYRYDPAATEAIKRELMAGRGVDISVFEDNVQEERGYAYYTNPETWSQYTYDSDGTGKVQGAAHAVCIVGWDDDWGVEKFKSDTTEASDGTQVSSAPPGPGAWIIRNSYGAEGQAFPNDGTTGYRDADGKHTGYYYLSYYDMSITRPSTFDFDVSGHVSDFINQHDLMPAPVPYTEKGLGERFANVFTAEADEQVHALSVETDQPNTHARLELWRLGPDDALADGVPAASVEADLEYGGFHRLSLSEPCELDEGERFAVVGQLTVEGESGGDGLATQDEGTGTVSLIPVHRDVNESSIEKYGNGVDSYVRGVVNPGESFLEVDGAWLDWAEKIPEYQEAGTLVAYYDYDNFPLKAYADVRSEPDPEPGPEPDPEPEVVSPDPADETGAASTTTEQPAEAAQPAAAAKPAKASALPKAGDPFAPWIAFAAVAAASSAAAFAALHLRRGKRDARRS